MSTDKKHMMTLFFKKITFFKIYMKKKSQWKGDVKS